MLAQDSAAQWLIGFTLFTFTVTFIYLVRLVYAHYRERQPPVRPQSLEGGSPDAAVGAAGTTADSADSENVTFDDEATGMVDGRGWTSGDPLRDAVLMDDASLENFFKRPLLIANYDWAIGGAFDQSFDPWALYFNNPRVINRIANYRLMKANLRVTFRINGNSFYYGRMLASYRPLSYLDDRTIIRNGVQADLVEASQRPHVYLNPSDSEGGQLYLPFFTPNNMLDVSSSEWTLLGDVNLSILQPLKHANGGTDPVSVSVFAHAEDVDVSILTDTNPLTIVPQSMEMGKKKSKGKSSQSKEASGIISKPASAIAKMAGHLTKVPIIGQYATATEIGAKAIGSMAALFGYSKPTVDEVVPFQPMSRQSMADTDGCENLIKLTVDSKNELSIDPKIASIEAGDELTISSIVSRESYLTTFPWNIGTAREARLFNIVVDPCVVRPNLSGGFTEMHCPALAYATLPFEYWKGSLKYRFQVVASGFHKGRLKFVYDPVQTATTSEYNTAYTQVVDISESNDFCIEVGWGQKTPWRQHVSLNTQITTPQFNDTIVVPYQSPVETWGNGTLAVYVVNELTSPSSAINNDIEINVFVSACEDFEVAAPNDVNLQNIAFHVPGSGPAGRKLTPIEEKEELEEFRSRLRGTIKPQSLEMDTPAVAHPESLVRFGPSSVTDNVINKIHMGEAVTSFRTLLKRYNLSEIWFIPTAQYNGDLTVTNYVRKAFPLEKGYTLVTNAQNTISTDLASGSYIYAHMTLMNYLSPCFAAWRGSIRYTDDTSLVLSARNPTNNALQGTGSWSVSRLSPELATSLARPRNDTVNVDYSIVGQARFDLNDLTQLSQGVSGASRWNTNVNGIQAYEVPYYSKYRFKPARQFQQLITDDEYQPSFKVQGMYASCATPYTILHHVAAGEDFTLMFYLSPPILYVEDLPPYVAPP
jgi:hypothetical protein